MNDYESNKIETANYWIPANAYLGLGEVNQTIESLRVGILNRDMWVILTLRLAPTWDSIRNDDRFQDLFKLLDPMETHTDEYLIEQERKARE